LKEPPTRVPDLDANEAWELHALWPDRRHADQAAERRLLIDSMPELLRQRDALVKQMPKLSTAEQLATGLRIQAAASFRYIRPLREIGLKNVIAKQCDVAPNGNDIPRLHARGDYCKSL
jgi:hypothetical protein